MAKVMTKTQFAKALDKLELRSHGEAAEALGISRRSVLRYQTGQKEVPEIVRRMLQMFEKHQVPQEWRA
jgi:predicted transcriptional regulator